SCVEKRHCFRPDGARRPAGAAPALRALARDERVHRYRRRQAPGGSRPQSGSIRTAARCCAFGLNASARPMGTDPGLAGATRCMTPCRGDRVDIFVIAVKSEKAMAYALTRQADRGLDRSAVAALRKLLRGPLLQPAEPGYEEARSIWNAMITKRPALIARV